MEKNKRNIISSKNNENYILPSNENILSNSEGSLSNFHRYNFGTTLSEINHNNSNSNFMNFQTVTKEYSIFSEKDFSENVSESVDFNDNINVDEINEDEKLTDFKIERINSNFLNK